MKVKVEAVDRAEWLRFRMQGIGASDAAAAVGLSPYCTPFQLWMEKTGRTPPSDESEAMKWGHRLQRIVGEAFHEETGRLVEPAGEYTIYEHPESPTLLATLDFFQRVIPQDDPGILEAKTAGFIKKDDWADTPPIHYLCQVQYQLLVTGLTRASIAVLIGGQKFLWADILPDREFQDRLRYHVEKFWRDHILNDVPPPVQAEDNEVIRHAYQQRTATIVPVDGSYLDWDERRQRASETIKALEKERDEAEAHIKAAIGENYGIILPNGTKYLWREERRKEYLVPASTRRTLRRS